MMAGLPAFQVTWYGELDSTNAHLRRRLASDATPAAGAVAATLNQTAGRGRAGRAWIAPPGRTLCFSLYIEPGVPAASIASLMPATALGVDDALRSLGVPSHPKWPNDVLVDDAKICGILAESVAGGVILGVGVNILLTRGEAADIDRPASSVLIATGRPVDPALVLQRVLGHMATRLDTWMQQGFEGLRADWMARVHGLGQPVQIEDNGRILRGRCAGYGPFGELLLDTGGAQPLQIWAGDLIHTLPSPRVPRAEHLTRSTHDGKGSS